MALDEYLFGKAAKYFKEKKRKAQEAQNRTVSLSELRPRLTVLACAASGCPIEVFPAEQEGGYKNNAFFLPEKCSFFAEKEQNHRFYLYRVLYLSTQKKLGFNWADGQEHALTDAREQARASAGRVLDALFEEYPVTRDWHAEFSTLPAGAAADKTGERDLLLYGKWMTESPESNTAGKAPVNGDRRTQHHPNAPTTVLKARIVEEIVQLQVDTKAQEDYVLTHNFEKVETAEAFSGVWRDFDGDDELRDHQEALDEISMKYTVRVDDPAHSVYQAEFMENTSVRESAATEENLRAIPYDEWDEARRAYKPGFCKLYPTALRETDAAYYQRTIQNNAATLVGLRKMLATLNNRRQQQRRQTQGEAFDIDSVTDLFVDVHTGHTPSEKIYLSTRKKEKDLSVLLLLDVSLSSDSYADGNRIIDVEKMVSILFGEILHEYGIDFSIHAFYSKTRNFATYITLKGFDDGWERAKFRIGAVQPGGYTRIGTALRHSRALLQAREAKNKWVILLSDGKPNDFDRYEGRYGIQDVRQALRELNESRIHAHALAIEATAKYYLPQMFGQSNYQILSSPAEMLRALVKLYEKMR